MRLYYKDADGSEITGVQVNHCSKSMWGGGRLLVTIPDFEMATINTYRSAMLERMEVRKADGTTVIWEGIIQRTPIRLNSIQLEGIEYLGYLDKFYHNYSGILAAGVVTSSSGADVFDRNQAFSADLVGKYALFSNTSGQRNVEIIDPDATSDFCFDPAADDPADVETKTPTGDETDIGKAGESYWEIYDNNTRGDHYYGIQLNFTAPNENDSTHVLIEIDCMFNERGVYTSFPKVAIYDNNSTAWEEDDSNNVGGITGLGDISFTNSNYNAKSRSYFLVIEITANISYYFNGSNICQVRVWGGQASAVEKVRVYQAYLHNTYSARFFTAGSTIYTIDAVDGTKLTFTGQTPTADGVAVGDTFVVGDVISNHIVNIWNRAWVNGVDLDYDASTKVTAINYNPYSVGAALRSFATQDNREVWQQIGWTIQCKSAYTDTTLNLTEANFLPGWIYTPDASEQFYRVEGVAVSLPLEVEYALRAPTTFYYNKQGARVASWEFGSTSETINISEQQLVKHGNPFYYFAGRIDLDDGTDYSALDVGKTVDIDMNTSKWTITAGVITSIAYSQPKGSHLYADLQVRI